VKNSVEERANAVGRKVAARRIALGFSQDDLAARAGMSPGYVEYVEGGGGRPSEGVLRRLAAALRTTSAELGGTQDLWVVEPELPVVSVTEERPKAPVVSQPSREECLMLMASVPVGRVAFVREGAADVLPVNFTVVDGTIVLLTDPASFLASLARSGRLVSFEADDVDESTQLGWSVLCHGPATIGSSDTIQAQLRRPWAGRGKTTLVVITPTVVTGRRLAVE